MGNKNRKDKKKSSRSLSDELKVRKLIMVQKYITYHSTKDEHIQKETTYNAIEEFHNKYILSNPEVENMDIVSLYEYVSSQLADHFDYEAVNKHRSDKITEMYETSKTFWKSKSRDKSAHVDLAIVKRYCTVRLQFNVGKYTVSYGYMNGMELDEASMNSIIMNQWDDDTDSIPLSALYEVPIKIKPITLSINIEEGNVKLARKQSYVTKNIPTPNTTSTVIINLKK